MEAEINQVIDFTHLWTDATGNPESVDSPTFSIFKIEGTGTVLTQETVYGPVTPAEVSTGRYAVSVTIDDTFEDGETYTAVFEGTDPGTSWLLHNEQRFRVVASKGLRSSFID